MERPHKELRTYKLWLKLDNKAKVARKLGGISRNTVDAHIKKAEEWDDYCQGWVEEWIDKDESEFPDEMPDDAYDIIMEQKDNLRRREEIQRKLEAQIEETHRQLKYMPKYPGCVDVSEEVEDWFRNLIIEAYDWDYHVASLQKYATDLFDKPAGRKKVLDTAAVFYLNDNYSNYGYTRKGVKASEAWGWTYTIHDGHTNQWNPAYPEDKERWERTWTAATETGLIDLNVLYSEYGGDNNE